MNSSKSTYSWKLIAFTVFIVLLALITFYFYLDYTKSIIRKILEAKLTSFIFTIVTIIVFVIHYFKHKSKAVESEVIITKKFGSFIDNLLGGVAYATAITTSLTLLKGLYIQNFFSDKVYFLEFQNIDLMTIFGVTLFMLYISFMKVIDIAKETYKVERTEQVLNEKGEVINVLPNMDINTIP